MPEPSTRRTGWWSVPKEWGEVQLEAVLKEYNPTAQIYGYPTGGRHGMRWRFKAETGVGEDFATIHVGNEILGAVFQGR